MQEHVLQQDRGAVLLDSPDPRCALLCRAWGVCEGRATLQGAVAYCMFVVATLSCCPLFQRAVLAVEGMA